MERMETMENRILSTLMKDNNISTATNKSQISTINHSGQTLLAPGVKKLISSNIQSLPSQTSIRSTVQSTNSWIPPGVNSPAPIIESIIPAAAAIRAQLYEFAPIEDSFRDEYVEKSNHHWEQGRKSTQETSTQRLPVQTQKSSDVKDMNDLAFM